MFSFVTVEIIQETNIFDCVLHVGTGIQESTGHGQSLPEASIFWQIVITLHS